MYNIYFGHFFIWQIDNNVVHKIYISEFNETRRKIYKICELCYYQNISDEQMTKINIANLSEIKQLCSWTHFTLN
jgi:hypothetical protein